jgi:peptide-methionine (R)-S-oxide reductase
MKQLENVNHYAPLDSNIMPQIQHRINRSIDKHNATGAIPTATANLLKVPTPVPAKFYMLPKVHKNMESPPGRPIMAGNNNPTERIAEYVDQHVKAHIHHIPSYIKDTNHFLDICATTKLPPNSRIVTFDVSALYTNIPHHEGVMALGEFMAHFTDMKTAKMLKDFTQLILESNIFEFNGKLYIQISGTSMGSKIGPQFANIFMHWLETKHLPNAPVKPLLWKRYIDDVFSVFQCSDSDLQDFTKWLNDLHPTIKFTVESSTHGVPFLDTFVSIRGDRLITKPHTKPTDTKQYLLPSSCHPPHILNSIPYSQALRIKRICTDQDTLTEEINNLKGFFINRKYSEKMVHNAMTKALNDAPQRKKTARNQDLPIPTALVVPFHPTNPPFQKTINDIWVKYKDQLNNLIGKPLVAYKRPKNLREMLTRARYGPMAIPPNRDPTHTAVKRPLTTFDRNQIAAPIKFALFYCNQHHELHEEFDSINQACHSQAFETYKLIHHNCKNVSIIPVDASHEIKVKCNECNFMATANTTKRTHRARIEMLNVCHTSQQARHRAIPTHHPCARVCQTCQLRWNSDNVINPSGTSYRLLPFSCKAKQVVYIIHCTLCDTHYVGMTNNTLRQRINNHLACIRNMRNTSIARHFTHAHDIKRHFRIGILDINTGNVENTAIREGFWISELRLVSHGINEKEESNLSMDYQIITLARHYHHSKTCAPFMSFYLREVRTRHLNSYRRMILKPRAPFTRSAPADRGQDQSREAARTLRQLRGT